ncbi:organic hydroperoxide resistance protein [Paenibacillus sp. N3.4]|uniref:organic hydroperoxide resistance protein n=1 Tax=Paenibacillus sp. N3.4 TaxID=2603222 RepID=UPI0011C843FB|nr:organic hydroperoxide resistance protein [Paenibacillus sp. N3.4]TXK74820.1 organic hydroperoxide resistance protein [Paenibacillus sp. N3.4]
MDNLYTAVATANGGRNGKVRSSDGVLDLDVKMPKELGGAGGAATNPEQLFAAGYSACFDSALNLVIRTKRVEVESTSVTAHVSIGKTDDGGFGLAVQLDVTIKGVSPEIAEELAHAAHQVCPYSKATRGNIEVNIHVVESAGFSF